MTGLRRHLQRSSAKYKVLTLVEAEKALLAPDPITAVIASLPIHPAAHTKSH